MSFFLEAARAALERCEVPEAVTRDRLRCLGELRPLWLVRVDELAASLQVQLASGRPADALLVGAARLGAAQDALVLEVAARAHHLLLQLAAAVADDALRLGDLAECGGARQLLVRLARLGGLQQHAHALGMGVEAGELGVLFVLPDIAPKPLPVIGREVREEHGRGRADRLPRAAVAAPAAVIVDGVGGVAAARADPLGLARQEPGAVHRVLVVAR